MSFIRPQARQLLYRWREALFGALVAMLGLSWVLGSFGLMKLLGYVFVLFGAGLIVVGVQRARFRKGAGGVGMVQVDEGQITYFGPLSGGAVALQNLERLSLLRHHKPAHWRLDPLDGTALLIPVNAQGADLLFDAFATLPELKFERMLKELNAKGDHSVVIWERRPLRDQSVRLH